MSEAPTLGVGVQWSQQQLSALEKIHRWVKRPGNQQIFRLVGFAGCGKTTLAFCAGAMAAGGAVFVAYTGKAAAVLRSKGCADAKTIHQVLYAPAERADASPEAIRRVDHIPDPGAGNGTLRAQIGFRLNEASEVGAADLVVIDEASMVDRQVTDDLLSFGTPILALGDEAQLPPIAGHGALLAGEPDVQLDEIHRQARGNPIIELSMLARQCRPIPVGDYGECTVMPAGNIIELAANADQVLCGRNRTRVAINREMRRRLGRRDWLPEAGDRLVCLENRHARGLLNGTIWTALEVWKGRSQPSGIDVVVLQLHDEVGVEVEAVVPALSFAGRGNEIPPRLRFGFDFFDYGYCLTVHKGQGSQWDDVLLIDESAVFRDAAGAGSTPELPARLSG